MNDKAEKRHEDMDAAERRLNAMEIAWGLIANAYGGDWYNAPDDWRKAAERWRDEYWHPELAIATEGASDAAEKPDVSKCPLCGGIVDNGHDRECPPNAYCCEACMSEGRD